MKGIELKPSAFTALALTAACILAGCTNTVDKAVVDKANQVIALKDPTFAEITQVANAEQRTVTDGWFFGELPRLFKSKYLLVPAEVKAQFAQELHSELLRRGENMQQNWNSYVPYRDRAAFAQKWWSNPSHSTEFTKQEKRYKVLWIHEALMDGSELWWHAFELKNGQKTPGDLILTHDVEQQMVNDYEDKERQLRSFSDEYARYKD